MTGVEKNKIKNYIIEKLKDELNIINISLISKKQNISGIKIEYYYDNITKDEYKFADMFFNNYIAKNIYLNDIKDKRKNIVKPFSTYDKMIIDYLFNNNYLLGENFYIKYLSLNDYKCISNIFTEEIRNHKLKELLANLEISN